MEHEIFAKLDFESLIESSKKGVRRQVQIAEAAISLLYCHGQEGFSYDLVAKKCKIKRPLIYKYFPTSTALFTFCSGLIRYRYQSYVVDEISKENTNLKRLEAYVFSALSWQDVFPKDVCVWLLFYHTCSLNNSLANFNRGLVDMGTQRIAAILEGGIYRGEFELKPNDCMAIARSAQILITGGIVSRASENSMTEAWNSEKQLLLKTILTLVKSA